MLRDRVLSMIRRLEQGDVNLHGFLLTIRANSKPGPITALSGRDSPTGPIPSAKR